MRTPTGFIEWCAANPTDNIEPGESWDQKCGSLVFRAGDFEESRSSAFLAALATEANGHRLDTSLPFEEIPRGWFVYFDIAGPDNGHVGMAMGDGTFLSANWRASNFGTGLGTLPIATYAAIATYMGASPFYVSARLADEPTPHREPSEEEEEDMPIIVIQKENSALAKAVLEKGKKRLISKGENSTYRALESRFESPVEYVTLSDDDFDSIPTV